MSEPRDHEALTDARGQELLIQLIRTLRVAQVHDLNNEAVEQVVAELTLAINAGLDDFQSLQLQCVGDNVYFNNEFVKLKGAAFEAATQGRRLYKKLGINEVMFNGKLEASEVRSFLERFQAAIQSSDPKSFAKERFAKISVRPIESAPSFNVDRKMELARTYGQLIVVFEEAARQVVEDKVVSLPRLRRAVQQLAAAAEGQEGLLAGLTRFHNPDGELGMHAAAVTSLVLLMAMRLGCARSDLVSHGMAALFHDMGRVRSAGSRTVDPSKKDDFERTRERKEALDTALLLAGFNQPKDVIDRAIVALERPLSAKGDGQGLLPSVASRLVAVACAFDRLVYPGPSLKGLRPEQASRLLQDHAGHHFDRRVLKLFTAVIGLYPIGSLVRLSGGQLAVVLGAPDDPALAARPTVKVIKDGAADADYLVELARDPSLRIVEGVDAAQHRVNVTKMLLA